MLQSTRTHQCPSQPPLQDYGKTAGYLRSKTSHGSAWPERYYQDTHTLPEGAMTAPCAVKQNNPLIMKS
eukprot:COSAG01_NODE_65915_length_271_cov_107.511628_1_plen_68_part_10